MRKTQYYVSVLLVMCLLFAFPGISFGAAQTADDGAAARGGQGNERGNSQGVIVLVHADNGTITAKFNKQPPGGKPDASDFTIQRQVNGGAAEVVVPSSYAWGTSTKIATFAVPPLAPGIAGREVVYSVSFKGAAFVPAATFAITALPPLDVVRNGQANAMIIVAAGADGRTQAAAATLAEYVQKSTGALLPVMTEGQAGSHNGEPDGPIRIYVGDAQAEPRLGALMQGMDGDGYVILPEDGRITIGGPTSWGIEYGVYAFLEKYVGVGWLMPGPDGEDVPQHATLSVSREMVKEEPAFISRVFSPLNGQNYPVQAEWARKNRMHSRISFHHNVYSLFPPGEFGQSHPEFYPVRNGVQYIPSATLTNSWQPCFSEPGTVDVAISKIIAFFDNNPDADSFSLGVNDGKGYCETEPDHPLYTGELNSVGVLDMSDIYYNWVNQVVEGVLAVYPDKWFGLLAYDSVMDPPSFKLNSRVVPFITQDRMAWIDAEIESQSKQKLEEWNQVADNIAWYDYMYGNPYLLPRMYTERMADNYAYAAEHGVLAHYSELYPNWGEGPKPWIAAKLQWDPDQDVEALLDEWYARAVGEEAAADLRAYYDHWEQFWTERIQGSLWFESRKRTTYLEFGDPSYLALVTEQEIAESRSLLESVVDKAGTAQQKARAAMLLRAFEYYEASALSYTPKFTSLNEQEALALLNPAALERKMEKAAERYELLDEFAQDPVLMHFIKPSPTGIYYPLLHWNGLDSEAFWAIADYMKAFEPNGGTVSQQVYGIAQHAENEKLREYADLLQNVNLDLFALNNNSSFELGGDVPQSWSPWYESNTVYKRSTDYSHSGTSSMMISTLRRGGPHQVVNVNPGMMASRVHYFTPEGTQTNATIQITFNLRDASNKQIGTLVSGTKKVGATAGTWSSVDFLTDIPEGVKSVQMIVLLNQVEPETKLYLDDFVIYQGSKEWLNAQTFWKFADYIQEHEPSGGILTNRVEALIGSSASGQEREFAQLLLNVLQGAAPVTANASFEQGTTTSAPPWAFYVQSQGTVTRVSDTSHQGSSSIAITGAKPSAVPYQYFIPKVGPAAAKVYYKLPEGATTAGTIQIGFNLNTADGKGITVMRSEIRPITGSPNGWSSINLAAYIPSEFNGLVVGRIQFTINVSNLENEARVYIDDANVYQ
ncbi:DUF4838 domain-containing protein [Paenibacillus contaminans]|uniref:DUF4838 domain-containing protein n=1 Tax=Paenibacillus contaminans TaxID=450362 RepID=A0A329MCW2_9BACL|nr:DUF4838 domain-containing protein [Paenibacillus contaminans]RAV17885.1 hypothetical protein DQG23_26110 [Paenibacillus contaminans]